MQIADLCTRKVIEIDADASLLDAAKLMRTHHVGALVVTDQPDGQRVPVGMLTDRDIVVAVVAASADAAALTVGDVMSREPATCAATQDVFDAIEAMRRRGVRRLPVLNERGGLCGIVTSDDVYGAIAAHMGNLSRALTREQVREREERS